MSFLKSSQSTKSFNPMHSSHIFVKSKHESSHETPPEQSKLSQWYTRATSEVGGDIHQYSNLVENYQSKLRNMQKGYQRSKQQFENSIKQMYKEKIILLNIISHNQELVDEFRTKIKIGPEVNFKEVENKYNIITSGLFHSQLCSNCIANISRTPTQSSRSPERNSIKNPEKSGEKATRSHTLGINKQYSWAYISNDDFQAILGKLKTENQKLKITLEQTIQENIKKINQKNKELDQLKLQLNKNSQGPIHKIVYVNQQSNQKQSPAETKEKIKQRELARQRDLKYQEDRKNKELYESLVKEMNEKILCYQVERLNNKYKLRYY